MRRRPRAGRGAARRMGGARWLVGSAWWLALAAAPAQATAYHVALEGQDSASGTLADPFKTVRRLQDLALRPGDQLLLRCGQRFAGPLRLRLDLAPGAAPVLIGGYGRCTDATRPVLHGDLPLPAAGDAAWSSLAVPGAVGQLFLAGQVLLPARYPANAYLALAATGQTAALDRLPLPAWPAAPQAAGASPVRDLAGAQAWVRTQEWFLESRLLRNASGALDKPLDYAAAPGTGVFFTGKRWMAEALPASQPAWGFDAADGRLWWRNPAGVPVSVSAAQPLLRVEGRGSLSLAGLVLDAAGADGLSVHLTDSLRLDQLDITRSAGNGLAVTGARRVLMQDSLIDGAGSDGVFLAEVGRAELRRNRVLGAGTYLGPRPALAAINAHRTEAALVEDNLVQDSGYIGIRVSGDAQVRRNRVLASCRHLADCAAIYTWRRHAQDLRPPVDISDNLIDGVAGDTAVKRGVIDYFAGIYLDEFTQRTQVLNNIVLGAAQGIYLHNASHNRVAGNLVVGARQQALPVKVDAQGLPPGAGASNQVLHNTVLDGSVRWQLRRHSGAAGPAWTLALLGAPPPPAPPAGAASAPGRCLPLRFTDPGTPPAAPPLVQVEDCR